MATEAATPQTTGIQVTRQGHLGLPSMGEPGSVAYLFAKKGTILVDAGRYAEDDLIVAVDAGAEDISTDDDVFEVVCEQADFAAVRSAL